MSQTRTSTKPRLFKKSKQNKQLAKEKSPKKKFVTKQVTKEKVREEKPRKRREFPNIFRFIPEFMETVHLPHLSFSLKKQKKSGKYTLVIVTVLTLIALACDGALGMLFYKSFITWSQAVNKRQKVYVEMNLWKNITNQYPRYRDAYFSGALLAYEVKDTGQMMYFLNKLQLIDPNFPLTIALEKMEAVQIIQ